MSLAQLADIPSGKWGVKAVQLRLQHLRPSRSSEADFLFASCWSAIEALFSRPQDFVCVCIQQLAYLYHEQQMVMRKELKAVSRRSPQKPLCSCLRNPM